MSISSSGIDFIFSVLSALFLLRIWLQSIRANFYHPLVQQVVRITNPVIRPLGKFLPTYGTIDSGALLLAYSIVVVKYVLLSSSVHWIIFVGALINLIQVLYHLILVVLVLHVIFSWVGSGRSPLEELISDLVRPLLWPIRRLIPTTFAGIDFSVMLFMLLLFFVNKLLLNAVASLGLLAFW